MCDRVGEAAQIAWKILKSTLLPVPFSVSMILFCLFYNFFRAFWAVTVMLAALLATYAIVESWKSYDKSSIDTVVETTFFNYADIAFPMVVVCDSSRVDWQRVMRLTAK